ncbi:profilin, partial [Aspergillus ibericus CBS 121593]
PEEVQSLLKGLSDASPLYSDGIYFEGQRYLVVLANERFIHGKKDKEAVYAVKTNQTFILAHSPEWVQQPEAAKVDEHLGDYLIGAGL